MVNTRREHREKSPVGCRGRINPWALALLVSFLTTAQSVPGSPDGRRAFRPGPGGDGGDAYINIEIEFVEVNRRQVSRGERIDFRVTLRNRGEGVPRPITIWVLAKKKVMASAVISRYWWDVRDRMVVTISWDTKDSEPGSYPVTVEAPLFGDAYEFDNVYRLSGEIVIRKPQRENLTDPSTKER